MDEISNLITTIAEYLQPDVQLAGGIVSEEIKPVHTDEWQLVAKAGKKRQREFLCGRYYAHQLLQAAGYTDYCIARDEKGCPIWPDGIAGSISHTNDYCVAILSSQGAVTTVGVDLEECGRMKESLWPRLFTTSELKRIHAANTPAERMRLAAIMFSAKEAFYKSDYPLNGRSYDFTVVDVLLDENHHLAFDFHKTGPSAACKGAYVVGVTHVMTVVYQQTS